MEKLIAAKKPSSSWKAAYSNSYLSYFILYMFYYLSWALFSSLISVYLISQGYSAAQASLVVSASFLTSMIFQPSIGSFADRIGQKKSTALLLFAALAGGAVFLLCRSFWMILIAYSFVMVLMNGTNPIMEKICTASPFSYGKIRIWGTVGYAAGTQLAGFLHQVFSPLSVFAAFLATMALCLLGAYGVQPAEQKEPENQEKAGRKGGIRTLLTDRKFLVYLVISGLFFGVTAASNTFIPALLTDGGMDTSLAGTILSAAVLCELPLILFSGKFMDRMTSKKLALIAFGLALLQIGVCAFALPSFLRVLCLLVSKHPGGMLFIMLNMKIVASFVDPAEMITALALVSTVKNLTSMLFNTMTGNMIDAFGYSSAFMVLIAFLALAFAILLFYRLPKGTDQKLFS